MCGDVTGYGDGAGGCSEFLISGELQYRVVAASFLRPLHSSPNPQSDVCALRLKNTICVIRKPKTAWWHRFIYNIAISITSSQDVFEHMAAPRCVVGVRYDIIFSKF